MNRLNKSSSSSQNRKAGFRKSVLIDVKRIRSTTSESKSTHLDHITEPVSCILLSDDEESDHDSTVTESRTTSPLTLAMEGYCGVETITDEEIHGHVKDAIDRIERLHKMGYNSHQERVLFVKWTIMHWEHMHLCREAKTEYGEIRDNAELDGAESKPLLKVLQTSESHFNSPSAAVYCSRRRRAAKAHRGLDAPPLGQIRGPGRYHNVCFDRV
jgi:hypothetical protein